MVVGGVFVFGPWANPGRLVPALVAGTLRAGGPTMLMEILSELRIVALAEGRVQRPGFSAKRARRFLEEMMVASLDLVLSDRAGSPEPDTLSDMDGARVSALMDFLGERIPIRALKPGLATEISLLCLQRPIVTDRALELLRLVRDHVPIDDHAPVDEGLPDDGDPEWEDPDPDRRLAVYLNAAFTPSEAVRAHGIEEYEAFLDSAPPETIEEECRALGLAMRQTGLAVPHHAVLARHVASRPVLLGVLLGLNPTGEAELRRHRQFVTELIERAIAPDLPRGCYGLGRLLDRGILSQQPVRSGLQRFFNLELHPDVDRAIRSSRPDATIDAPALLLVDVIAVLGQPLGVGQGRNPTCQSARGISLWSRHAPGKLLDMIRSVARSHDLTMRFEGDVLRASELGLGLVKEFDHDLDAVSVVLVPHLDRIYNEMMRRAAWRGDDPHKWVNPAMYGHWIPTGFRSAYDYATDAIRDYDGFLRTFYATHHPRYNRGHDLAYPNPVGIFLTSATGELIGFHAVSILRVREVRGATRVYLFNPNSEGRQRWHADIRPTVAGNGERPGESSLPFHEFASILYAFHYNPSDVGDLDAVDTGEVDRVRALSESSWGDSYRWVTALGLPEATGAEG
ncbi:MAG: hypothetical protein EA351_04525 [Gemmatimonadales bacterium]|nr:MAG: hypothetical protein EA351_04525 [Gemmatimonadales bacterium]